MIQSKLFQTQEKEEKKKKEKKNANQTSVPFPLEMDPKSKIQSHLLQMISWFWIWIARFQLLHQFRNLHLFIMLNSKNAPIYAFRTDIVIVTNM